jgi:hypothetical protein
VVKAASGHGGTDYYTANTGTAGSFEDDIRPFTVMQSHSLNRKKSQTPSGPDTSSCRTQKNSDLHGRPMVNIVSGESFHIYDKNSSRLPKPPGWLSLRTMEDELNRILSRAESKFCARNGGICTSRTVGLLAAYCCG